MIYLAITRWSPRGRWNDLDFAVVRFQINFDALRFGAGETFYINFALRQPLICITIVSPNTMTEFSFFSIIFVFRLMLFFCFIVVLLRVIITIFCDVAVIFCRIIIVYFTCCTLYFIANFLLYAWTACFFYQNNALETIMSIYSKTTFHIFLVVNFICISLMGDRK